jgi:hypothetical protein
MSKDGISVVSKNNKSTYVVIAFVSSGIGAVLGLVAYLKDWL